MQRNFIIFIIIAYTYLDVYILYFTIYIDYYIKYYRQCIAMDNTMIDKHFSFSYTSNPPKFNLKDYFTITFPFSTAYQAIMSLTLRTLLLVTLTGIVLAFPFDLQNSSTECTTDLECLSNHCCLLGLRLSFSRTKRNFSHL